MQSDVVIISTSAYNLFNLSFSHVHKILAILLRKDGIGPELRHIVVLESLVCLVVVAFSHCLSLQVIDGIRDSGDRVGLGGIAFTNGDALVLPLFYHCLGSLRCIESSLQGSDVCIDGSLLGCVGLVGSKAGLEYLEVSRICLLGCGIVAHCSVVGDVLQALQRVELCSLQVGNVLSGSRVGFSILLNSSLDAGSSCIKFIILFAQSTIGVVVAQVLLVRIVVRGIQGVLVVGELLDCHLVVLTAYGSLQRAVVNEGLHRRCSLAGCVIRLGEVDGESASCLCINLNLNLVQTIGQSVGGNALLGFADNGRDDSIVLAFQG